MCVYILYIFKILHKMINTIKNVEVNIDTFRGLVHDRRYGPLRTW